MTLELKDGRFIVPLDARRELVAEAHRESREALSQTGNPRPVLPLDVMARIHSKGIGVTEAEVREAWPETVEA